MLAARQSNTVHSVIFEANDLIALFNGLFIQSHNTLLVGQGEEPEYVPAPVGSEMHRIVFTRDYFSSALHEVAHWCIAGPERRKLPDYGYWYAPDGRSLEQQVRFQSVEVSPQALECLFSEACGKAFMPSLDNLEGDTEDGELFAEKIAQRVEHYRTAGLPQRAELFLSGLEDLYGTAVSRVVGTIEKKD